jgi:hypothetical protein
VIGSRFAETGDASRLEHPAQLGQHLCGVGDVMEGLKAVHPIHRGVREVDVVTVEDLEDRLRSGSGHRLAGE